MNRRVFIKTSLGLIATFMFGSAILKNNKHRFIEDSGTEWDSSNTNHPIADIIAAKEAMRKTTGLEPTTIFYRGRFYNLSDKVDVRDWNSEMSLLIKSIG